MEMLQNVSQVVSVRVQMFAKYVNVNTVYSRHNTIFKLLNNTYHILFIKLENLENLSNITVPFYQL
jgi:hypothetical protein